MDREALKRILPHREPMLLLDRAELVDGEAIASYSVRGDEFFLQGHFPGHPVVPGVILCEMMAQACCVLLEGEMSQGSTPYYTGIRQVKFREKVEPGCELVIRCRLANSRPPFYFAEGTVHIAGDVLAAEGAFSFAVLEA
jgi:3-hydroxyacyl-[acyl-carrier-protein] dehydratase